jgi:hypothetical protein
MKICGLLLLLEFKLLTVSREEKAYLGKQSAYVQPASESRCHYHYHPHPHPHHKHQPHCVN